MLDPKPWSYSAYLPVKHLPSSDSPDQKVMIEITLQTECGSMGILCLERGSTMHLLAPEQNIDSTTRPVKVSFEIDSIEEIGNIVFRSWPNNDAKTIAKIFSVEIMAA